MVLGNDANVETGTVQNTQNNLPRILQMPAAKDLDKKLIFVGTGRLQMPQLIREITITDPTRNEFTSKHSMEWKFLFLDHRAPPIIGYMPFEVLGTSGYDYYHFDDIDDIVACHERRKSVYLKIFKQILHSISLSHFVLCLCYSNAYW